MTASPTDIDVQTQSAPLMVSASGLRGIIGASLTPSVIVSYTHAILHALTNDAKLPKSIVVGRDGRASGAPLHKILTGTLQAAGVHVIDLDIVTTPTVGIMVRHHNADGGIVLTASHNPQEWNGIKAIDRTGAALAPDHARVLIDAYRQGVQAHTDHANLGTARIDDTASHVHVARVLEFVHDLCPIDRIQAQSFSAVVDSVNASGSRGAQLLLDALGVRAIHLHSEQSGIFPHEPEPTADNLSGLSGHVTRAGASVGFAQDPDADRLAIIDDLGRYIGEEYTLALAAMAVLESPSAHSITVAANLSTSRMIDDIAANAGGTVLRTPVGEANVVKGMRDSNALLGGEGNGGVIVPAVGEIRDSLTAMALTLALLTLRNEPLSDITDRIPSYAIIKRKAPAPNGLDPAVLERVSAAFPGATANNTDGLRLDMDNPHGKGKAWVHVRASNTEPIIRVIAEAQDAASANAICDQAETAIAG